MGITVLSLLVTNIVIASKDHKERKLAKKPLKYTSRAKRLVVYNFFILVILQFLFMGFLEETYPKEIKALLDTPVPRIESYSGDTVLYENAVKEYYKNRITYNEYNHESY